MFIGQDFLGATWNMFATTGQIGYYLLYKQMLNEEVSIDGVNPPHTRDILD